MKELDQQFVRHEDNDERRNEGRESGTDLTSPDNMAEQMMILSKNNKSIFKRLTERAKKTAQGFFKSIRNKIPKKDDVFASAKIATNEIYMHRHERISLHWGKEVEGIQMQIDALTESANNIQTQIEDFREKKLPGIDDLVLSKRTILQQIDKLEGKKDGFQDKFESEQNRMYMGANERNQAASEIIRRAKNTLEPFERDLETLGKRKAGIETALKKLESTHEKRKAELDDLENRKTVLENALMMGKKTRREVKRNPSVIALEKLIANGHKQMEKQKADLFRLSNEIDSQISEVDKEAAPIRSKIFKYSRMEEEAPTTNESVKERQRTVYNLPPLKIRTHLGEVRPHISR